MENEIERVLIGVEGDLRFWKRMMGDLAHLFQKQFPPKSGTKHVWLLVVQKCAASKNCTMCPHSIVWRRYFYPTGERKKRRLFGGKGKGSIERRLPQKMRLTTEIRKIFEDFEEVRKIIMLEHGHLAKIRKRLLALKREAKKRGGEVSANGMANLMRDLKKADRNLKDVVEDRIWNLRLEVPRILEARRKIREERNRRLFEGWTSKVPSKGQQ